MKPYIHKLIRVNREQRYCALAEKHAEHAADCGSKQSIKHIFCRYRALRVAESL